MKITVIAAVTTSANSLCSIRSQALKMKRPPAFKTREALETDCSTIELTQLCGANRLCGRRNLSVGD